MKKLQYNQEILFTTLEGKQLDCKMFDNFDAVIRFYVKGTGHASNSEMSVYGLQHGAMICTGDNRPYAKEQVNVTEDEVVMYRDEKYIAKYVGDYSDALKFEPVHAYTHCLEVVSELEEPKLPEEEYVY